MKLRGTKIFLCMILSALMISGCGKLKQMFEGVVDNAVEDAVKKAADTVPDLDEADISNLDDTDLQKVDTADETDTSFAFRMADGTERESVSHDELVEGLESLDADNFFLVLTRGNDYIQTAIAEDGYIIEYNESGDHYTTTKTVSEEEMMKFFSMYYKQKDGWKNLFEWRDH